LRATPSHIQVPPRYNPPIERRGRWPGSGSSTRETKSMAPIDRIRHHGSAREERHLTKVFKALSDGTRQEILRLLESQQRTVGEIVGKFNLSQPTISRALSCIKI